MKKTLRFALVAFFSAIALGASAQTTIWEEDFSSYSSGDVPSGGSYNYACTDGDSSTKIYKENNAGGTAPELLVSKNGGTFTATIPLNNVEGTLTLTFKTNNNQINVGTSTEGISGSLNETFKGTHTLTFEGVTSSMTEIVVFFNAGTKNVRLDDIKLVTGGAAQEYQEVSNIAELKALESGTKAKLTFTNVQVNFASGNDMYVQDATGAIDIYSCGLTYKAGQKLNGTAVVEYKLYNGMPEITSVSNAVLTVDEGTATPTEPALDAINNSLLCHLVKATGTVYIENNEETGYTNYFLEDEEGNSVQFYRKWTALDGTDLSGLTDGATATVTGIVVLLNGTPAIGVTEIEYEGGGSQETITAANIAAFKALEDGTVAELTLTDAVVTFVNGKDMYVTDATGSIDFYNCNLSYTAGKKLNGKIKVKYTVYKNTPEAVEPAENNLTATDGEATPQEVAVSSVDISKVCDYVKISGKVKVLEETSGDKTFTNYYIADESDNKVMIYRKWKSLDGTDVTTLNDGDEATITGIVVPFNDTVEIAVTAMESTSSGIENINAEIANDAPIFNIAGQRVEKAVKGIYIQNGKKFIVK